ncbi:MFS transporter [Scleromatobacter humisilvae]|uniref:MFS transporter n=1 Tax=Scleromatobacter humisilvae TaxID=2897159 RepID=A0A9X1YNP8_9BURK|nr:MFS transporter [Scleromatobacter humisilvae]MCK9684921.1 MFS transporter [Scleromatobacter humisilvae]
MAKLHYGWVIVAAGALMTWMAMGALLALPVFLAPISADTGWSRGGIGFAMTLNFLTMGIGSAVWGGLSDRYGPRMILVTGVLLLGAGLALASRATSLLEFQAIYGLLIGIAAGSLMVPLMSTVTLWFDKHRALAVSLVSSGIGVAPMTVSPFAASLVVTHGWRTSELILAAAVVVLLLPAALCIRRPPHMPAAASAGGMGGPELKAAARRALRSRPFIVLSLTFFACCATHAGPIFHTISYAIGCGLPAMTAVTIYSVEGFAGLVGRLLFGVLADRVGVKRMIVLGLLTQALAAGSYVLATGLSDFYAVAFIFGMAYGGVMPLYSALARDYFAPQIMGSVLGAMTLLSGIGMALGPALGGWIYDRFHAYTWMYLGSLAVGLGAAAIALALPRVRTSGPALAVPA